MTTTADATLRPHATADYRAPSLPRRRGIVLAVVGLIITLVAFIGNLVATGQSGLDRAATLAWTFGVTTTGFAAIKAAIAVVLWGILAKLWLRAASIRETLPSLMGTPVADSTPYGGIETPLGKATVSAEAPGPLPIHTMAKRLFRPMAALGLLVVVAGLVVSIAWSGSVPNVTASAWTQGLQFLGEAMLLSGIAFLLGTILWAIRTAGGEVQESLGVKVYTPRMPRTAKAFVGLMAVGLMAAVVQFVGYVVAARSHASAVAFAWLGPLREAALGLILAGIALALVTIGNVLAFQFNRMGQLIRSGERV